MVSHNNYTSSGEERQSHSFSQASTECPFVKSAISMPAIIRFFVSNYSCHGCYQPRLSAITPSVVQLQMKTVLHVQLMVTKQKEAQRTTWLIGSQAQPPTWASNSEWQPRDQARIPPLGVTTLQTVPLENSNWSYLIRIVGCSLALC